jgi:hypothetical protein
MGVVMNHLAARVLRVLKDDRPYEIRDLEGKSIVRMRPRDSSYLSIMCQKKYGERGGGVIPKPTQAWRR